MKRIRLKKPETLDTIIVDKEMVLAYQYGDVYKNIYDTGIQYGFKTVENILLDISKNDEYMLSMFCHFLPEMEILRWIHTLPRVKVFIQNSLVTI